MKNSCVQWVAKESEIVLPYLFDSDLRYNFRQGWRHVFNGYCDHCSWKKLNNWLQMQVKLAKLRCCNQSVHVYQNCLGQSQKHVCNGAYDHYNYMVTRFNIWRLVWQVTDQTEASWTYKMWKFCTTFHSLWKAELFQAKIRLSRILGSGLRTLGL